MTKYGSNLVSFILIDGYSLAQITQELTENIEALSEETHGFNEDWVKNEFTGITRIELEWRGWYDDEALKTVAAFSTQNGNDRILTYGVSGNEVGAICSNWKGGLQVNYSRLTSRGELHKIHVKFSGAGDYEQGVALQPLEALDGDGESDSYDDTDGSSDGASVYLHVTSLTLDGASNVVFTIEHSDDELSWDTLEAFSSVTIAPTVERRVVTGAVKRHLRVKREFTGVGEDSAVEALVSLVRY
jgi:hypothetical protein